MIIHPWILCQLITTLPHTTFSLTLHTHPATHCLYNSLFQLSSMKHTILSAIILLPLAYSRTAKELCRGTAELSSDGNWYCSEVWAITYRNISQPGAYNRTTTVDPKTGICGHERVDYPSAGPLTPLFGQVWFDTGSSCCIADKIRCRCTFAGR